MKTLQLSLMAARYFRRYFRRYLFLFIALCFGYGIITTITGLQAGMNESVNQSAQSHYAGDMALVGRSKSLIQFQIHNVKELRTLIETNNINYKRIIQRTQFGNTGTIYFNGAAVRHKYTLGIKWDDEADYFSKLSYTQGEFGDWNKEEGIIVSSPVAHELGLSAGDSVLLEVKTRTGQINTGSFIVQAVVDDATIFGYYKCYVDRDVLNGLIGFGANEASTFGIYLKEGADVDKEARKLQAALESAKLNVGPLVNDKDELLREYGQPWKGSRLFVITLPVYLSEVAELLTAIELIAYFLYLLMILIIIVSVAVTFRLILHEREKEIGTLRSVGFYEADIVFLLMMETVILFFCSLLAGFVFARVVVWGMGFINLSSVIPSFEIFMKNGRLVPVFTIRTTLINSAIVLAALIPTVALPVLTTARKPLSAILAGEK